MQQALSISLFFFFFCILSSLIYIGICWLEAVKEGNINLSRLPVQCTALLAFAFGKQRTPALRSTSLNVLLEPLPSSPLPTVFVCLYPSFQNLICSFFFLFRFIITVPYVLVRQETIKERRRKNPYCSRAHIAFYPNQPNQTKRANQVRTERKIMSLLHAPSETTPLSQLFSLAGKVCLVTGGNR